MQKKYHEGRKAKKRRYPRTERSNGHYVRQAQSHEIFHLCYFLQNNRPNLDPKKFELFCCRLLEESTSRESEEADTLIENNKGQ
jgi:hypothetical protein